MNRVLAKFLALCLSTVQIIPATDLFRSYYNHRFDAPEMQVREVEGLPSRISDGKLHLVLRDFLTLVLKNSADIQMVRMDVYTQANQIVAAKAPFDPSLLAGFSTLRSLSPPFYFPTIGTGTGTGSLGAGAGAGSSIGLITPQTINSLAQQSNLSYSQLLPTGQTINTTFGASRSSGDGYPSPALFGNLNFSLTQPLLQNRSNLQFRGPLRIARMQLVVVSQTSAASIGLTVANAAIQYWQAILARDSIRVQEETLALAQKSYDRDKKALDLGALAKLDIFQSETQVAERQRDLIEGRYQYTVALDALRRLIGADLTPELRATPIVQDDDASRIPAKSSVLPFESALTQALRERPEIKAAGQRLSVDDLSARVSRDSLLPRLDLNLQGGATGPGFNQLSPTAAYPGLGDTLRQVVGFNYPSYGFGLQLNFPLRNSAAQANLATALVSKARDAYQQRQAKEQVILDTRQAITSIELANASIEAATRARDLAKKNVDAEQQKYELGTITAFEVLDSQTRLASSESSLLSAFVAYQQAYINYQYATWTLLDGLGMVLETPTIR
jgi:outer membrane protein